MNKFLSVIITSFVLIFLIIFLIKPKLNFSYNENRYLSDFPEVNINDVISGKFFSGIDKYFSDHFPFRDSFLSFKTFFNRMIGMYRIKDIYYGTDGALYQEFSKSKNSSIIVDKVNTFISKVNIPTKFMLIPTSISIYNQYIDKYNLSYDENVVIDYYRNNIGDNFIDVRDILQKNKNDYIFYRTDHHYTTRGAYLAYLEYCKSNNIIPINYEFETINHKFYGTLYSKVLDNRIKSDIIEKIKGNYKYYVKYIDKDIKISDSLYDYNYLNKKDKYLFFLGGNHSLVEIKNDNFKDNTSILIIKDSFANSFIPFIVNNFKNVYVIDLRYFNDDIYEYINSKNIDEILFLYNVYTIDDDRGIFKIN